MLKSMCGGLYMKVKIGISNRHIHLSQTDANILFKENYQFKKRNDLSQKGEFATEDTVIIKTDNYTFDHVRVVGPIRDYTQVEISESDAKLLGINPPVRDSGDLDNSEDVLIIGPSGSIFKKNCCIIPNRHIHCNKLDNFGYTNGDVISGSINGKIMNDIHVKEKDSYVLELHITKDDATLYGVENGDYIDI